MPLFFDPHTERIAHTLLVHRLLRLEDELHRLKYLGFFQFADHVVHKLPIQFAWTTKSAVNVVLAVNIDVDFFHVLIFKTAKILFCKNNIHRECASR